MSTASPVRALAAGSAIVGPGIHRERRRDSRRRPENREARDLRGERRGSGLALVTLMLAACADAPASTGSLESTRELRGDTTIVTITGGSVWDSASLVEELRIGALEGAEEYQFGYVQALAPDGAGGVYAFDGQVPALRHYDATGAYVGTLGGQGAGPGEYQDAALGLAMRPDGRLQMYDPRNARLNLYDREGNAVDHWSVASGLFAQNTMMVDDAGHTYIKVLTGPIERNEPWPIGLMHLDAAGAIVDTIFMTGERWDRSPVGYTMVGDASDYAFEIRNDDGTVVRVKKEWTPVALFPEERSEREARNEWMRRNRSQVLSSDIPPEPATKPAYASIRLGHDGRVWVRRHVPSVKMDGPPPASQIGAPPITWTEPAVYDLFEADGTYLGEVRPPPRTTISWSRGDTVWATTRGEMDESYIVRLRLETIP